MPDITLTPQLNRIMKMAAIEAERTQEGPVGVQHVLVAMFQDGTNPGAAMIEKFNLTLEDVRALNFDKKA